MKVLDAASETRHHPGVALHDGKGEPDVSFRIDLPPDLEPGEYANFLGVWHTAHEFTLDFASTQPAQASEDGPVLVPCRVVARVKIPVTVVFDVIRALNDNMTRYESTYGEIKRFEPPAEGMNE